MELMRAYSDGNEIILNLSDRSLKSTILNSELVFRNDGGINPLDIMVEIYEY